MVRLLGGRSNSNTLLLLDRMTNMLSTRDDSLIVFYDDMEDGINNWTTQTLAGSDLWHQTNSNFNSENTSWWCGIEDQGNYDNGITTNALISPDIDLTDIDTTVTLQFFENYNVESLQDFDLCIVDISTDDGLTWTNLRLDEAFGSSGGWILTTLDLTPFCGSEIYIRFLFDTIDIELNDFPGWYVDDVLVYTAEPPVPWLSSGIISGIISPGLTQSVDILFDATGMVGGEYNGNIVIQSNDPDEQEIIVPVGLTVTGAPSIIVQPESIDFGDVFVDGIYTENIVISNQGTDILEVSGLEIDAGEFNIDTNPINLQPGDHNTLQVSFIPTLVGEQQGIVTIISNDPTNSETHILLTGTGLQPPDIEITPVTLQAELIVGDSTSQILTIENNGFSNLNYQVQVIGSGSYLNENFNIQFPHSQLTLYNSAVWNENEGVVYVVPSDALIGGNGGMFTNVPISSDYVEIRFDFEIGGGTGADGLVLAFLSSPELGTAGHTLAFFNSPADGWGIEFDTYSNGGESENHIAVDIIGGSNPYFVNNNIPELEDSGVFTCEIIFDHGNLLVWLENSSIGYLSTQVINYTFTEINTINEYIGFTASIGNLNNNHIVDNLEIIGGAYWLTVLPQNGNIPSGSSDEINVGFNSTNLFGGDYIADILITSNDPDEPEIIVPVTLSVDPGPTFGDLNYDGILDILDIVRMVNLILGDEPTEYEQWAGDMNYDDELNVQDIIMMVNIIMGIEPLLSRPGGQCTIKNMVNRISINPSESIAGVQLKVTGDFSITEQYLPPNWQLHHNNSTILFFSSDGTTLMSDHIFGFRGELVIENYLVVDRDGHEISTTSLQPPATYFLSSAYPNPFNPVTNISYGTADEGLVQIVIYDLRGRLVQELVNEYQSAGSYAVLWDGTNYSSGTYFVKMKTADQTTVKKILLLK